MKTFVKVLLLIVAAMIALKLLPLAFGLGWMLGAAIVGLLVAGVSMAAALAGALLVLTVALSPVWVPILAIVGLISLFKGGSRHSRVAAA